MTNKLPIVGRYRLKNKHNYIVEVLPILTVKTLQDGTGSTAEYGIEVFNDIFEELPEDNSQQTEQVKVTENAVDEAKEELRKEVKKVNQFLIDSLVIPRKKKEIERYDLELQMLHLASMKLLDALDAEKASSEPKQEKPKSIWKPVSKLPKEDIFEIALGRRSNHGTKYTFLNHVLYKGWFSDYRQTTNHAGVMPETEVDSYITLTDFINAFEQMQQDILELKKGR